MSEDKTEKKFKEPRDVKLMPGRMKPQEYARNLWVITVEDGVTIEDIMKPGFWGNVAINMRPYDRVEVRCDNDEFFAELLVLRADRTSALVKKLSFIKIAAEEAKVKSKDTNKIDSDDYEYKFRGPQKKHSIVRKSDNAVMVENMESKEAALGWLATYLSEQRAA